MKKKPAFYLGHDNAAMAIKGLSKDPTLPPGALNEEALSLSLRQLSTMGEHDDAKHSFVRS